MFYSCELKWPFYHGLSLSIYIKPKYYSLTHLLTHSLTYSLTHEIWNSGSSKANANSLNRWSNWELAKIYVGN